MRSSTCSSRPGSTRSSGSRVSIRLELYDALAGRPSIRHILTRHEQGAAFAADGFARVQPAARRPVDNDRTGHVQHARGVRRGMVRFVAHRPPRRPDRRRPRRARPGRPPRDPGPGPVVRVGDRLRRPSQDAGGGPRSRRRCAAMLDDGTLAARLCRAADRPDRPAGRRTEPDRRIPRTGRAPSPRRSSPRRASWPGRSACSSLPAPASSVPGRRPPSADSRSASVPRS